MSQDKQIPIHILGAGLAGSIMHSVLGGRAVVIEKGSPHQRAHRAVLHFRDPRLGQILDLEFQKVRVNKSIYYKGRHYTESNLYFNNCYSLKTLGVIQDRSIGDLTEKERWIAPGAADYSHKIDEDINQFYCTIRGISNTGIELHMMPPESHSFSIGRETIISTLPMPVLMKLVGMSTEGMDFEATPIHVVRFKFNDLQGDFSQVCQTIYFPDPMENIYRATIDHNEVIIECLELYCGCPGAREVSAAMQAFGVPSKHWPGPGEIEIHTQPAGKIRPLSDNLRKSILYELTTKHNIYSLGRFALWQNLRADDVLKDALKIKSMLTQSKALRGYTAHKEGGTTVEEM